ncbi:hypothetical protein [Alicyclobacillus sp. ALC3]|uniref:hypothetical protein n=1 Tax=Alicyclobacillus sp. ALC3 TaxID=2796143 RepID=UPI002378C2CE|nr:hypothetical protein [Alicyclobacillus sp. ALC3]WDL99213.1 hypothetical protein JC200_11530 [Alicyclobacillus sp. ALC3]
MERILVKTWLYTFLVTLSLCILYVPTYYHSNFTGSGYVVSLREYVLELLRTSLSVSLIVTAIAAVLLGVRFVRKKR